MFNIDAAAILESHSFLAGAVADTETEIFFVSTELRCAPNSLAEYHAVHKKPYGKNYLSVRRHRGSRPPATR